MSPQPSRQPAVLRPPLWLTYLLLGGLVGSVYVFVAPLKGSGPVLNCLGAYGVVGVVGGIRRHRPKAPGAWWCFAAGLALFWLGDVYTYSDRILFRAAMPFPSIGDALYLSVYPVLMAGLVVLVRRRNRRAHGPGLVDSMILTFGLALLSGILLIAPYVHDHALKLVPKLVSIGYPAGDIILLAAAARLAVDVGKRRPAFYLLIASIVTLLATDFIYGLLTLHNAYDHQLWLDAGWILFYLLWGAAALHPSMRELADPEADERPRLSAFRLALLAGATLIAPALLVARELPRRDFDGLWIAGASILLFVLVVARMAGLVRQREKSIARESALTAAGAQLVAASSRDEIDLAALEGVTGVCRTGVQARLCRWMDGRLEVTAPRLHDDGSLMRWEFPAGAEVVFARGEERLVRLTDILRAGLRLEARDQVALVMRLGHERLQEAALVATGPGDPGGDTRSVLRALATQVTLALESAELSEEVHRRDSEARFASLVQNSTDLITVLSSDGTIRYQSPSIERVLGYRPEDVVGHTLEVLLHPSEQGRLLRVVQGGVAATRGPAETIQCCLRHKDGGVRDFEISCTDLLSDDTVGGIVLNGRDVSERKAFEEQLAHQAFHDSVTHLANRALFNERVRHAVARSRREHIGLAVVFIDLDDFKTVNDSLGHAAGDRVLLEVAQRISQTIRAGDTAARFGGDEFALLLEDVGDERAAETADRVLAELRRPVVLEHTELVIGASLGISVAEAGAPTDADELIRNADAAMYIAKAEGKDGYRMFEPAMHERVLARLELRSDLQRALERDEFELHYQPLVRLSDGAVTGIEALLRWRHPHRGLVSPAEFIPFAEESGLIVPLGRWVLREGCRQAALLRSRVKDGIPPTIAINLSVRQLFDSHIVADVTLALALSQLPPQALTLEITESVMMTDTDLAVERLTALRALGVRLAMDDFGTGYSSLSYLSRLPIDILKMDRSLLAAGASAVTSGLAKTVLSLGDTFQLDVVAEGIELPEQELTLRELGCELGQGFYFAEPMPPDALGEFIRGRAAAPAGD